MPQDTLILDTITDAGPSAKGLISVSGSHGGLYAAAEASRAGLRAVILNDAGRGLNDAGIAGIKALDAVGMAGCTVDCQSAEIGSATDSLSNGMISFANDTANSCGVAPGMEVKDAIGALKSAAVPHCILGKVPEARWEQDLHGQSVICVDSASLVIPSDAGRIVVTGSHGGLIGGDPTRACKADATFYSFSDAGLGKNNAGIARLAALDARGIAAVALDCFSCEIGSAASALETGKVSTANRTAKDCGIQPGCTLIEAISMIAKTV